MLPVHINMHKSSILYYLCLIDEELYSGWHPWLFPFSLHACVYLSICACMSVYVCVGMQHWTSKVRKGDSSPLFSVFSVWACVRVCVCVFSSTCRLSLQQTRWFREHRPCNIHWLWPFTTAAVNIILQLCACLSCCVVVLLNMAEIVHLSHTCHYQYAFVVNDMYILGILHFSVRLCLFSACWLTPGTLCSCQCPDLDPRGLSFFFCWALLTNWCCRTG